MNNTPTPRTDANDLGWQFHEQYDYFDSLSDDPIQWVDFARILETELAAVTEQRDKYRDIASELIAMIRINVIRDTFKIATTEQVDEHLKPWIARIAAVKGGADES